jgi:hypothetical protein
VRAAESVRRRELRTIRPGRAAPRSAEASGFPCLRPVLKKFSETGIVKLN